jgi:hypothetical protein
MNARQSNSLPDLQSQHRADNPCEQLNSITAATSAALSQTAEDAAEPILFALSESLNRAVSMISERSRLEHQTELSEDISRYVLEGHLPTGENAEFFDAVSQAEAYDNEVYYDANSYFSTASQSTNSHSEAEPWHTRIRDEISQLPACVTASLHRLGQLSKFIAKNQAESTIGRYACNVANISAARTLSVFFPTLIREMIRAGLEEAIKGQETRTAIAAMAAAMPLALQTYALIEENLKSKTATLETNASRGVLLIAGTGAVAAAATTGQLPALGAALPAYGAYCVMRDAVQNVVQLRDDTLDFSLKTTVISASAYVLNQCLTSSAMSYVRAPSVVGGAALKALWNFCGEFVDEVVRYGLANREEGLSMRAKLSLGLPSIGDVTKIVRSPFTSRLSLFTTTPLASVAIGAATTSLSREAATMIDNTASALLLGAQYIPFARIAVSQAQPHQRRESEIPLQRLDGIFGPSPYRRSNSDR